ncbi:IMV protein [Yokapox virus]|uniref:IMV protein n=1 Tax=Yokapox virus TaxID=1076255 RepID=G3EIA9_9POXV|nr:IMV protein [Yokapox virus]AEN03620.1 IMV protein [Yokapox virus]
MIIQLAICLSVVVSIIGIVSNVLDMFIYVKDKKEEDKKIDEENELLLLY